MDSSSCCVDTSTNGFKGNQGGTGNANVSGVFGNALYMNGNGDVEITGSARSFTGFSICAFIAPESAGAPNDRRNLLTTAGAGNMGMYQLGNNIESNNDNAAGCSEQAVGNVGLTTGTYQAVCVVRRNGYRTETWQQASPGNIMQLTGKTPAASCNSFVGIFHMGSQNNGLNFYKGKIWKLILSKEEFTPGQIAYWGSLRNHTTTTRTYSGFK